MFDMLKGETAGIRRKPDRSRALNKQAIRVMPLEAGGGMTARVSMVECVLVEDNLIHRRDKPTGVFQLGW